MTDKKQFTSGPTRLGNEYIGYCDGVVQLPWEMQVDLLAEHVDDYTSLASPSVHRGLGSDLNQCVARGSRPPTSL